MKQLVILFVFLLGVPIPAHAGDLLTGDTRLACEAILCLSSPARPSECSPSLSRYFGIKKKKFKNTMKARRNFLQLCPTASDNDVMVSLTNALTYGSGRCEASDLNARGRWVTEIDKFEPSVCRDKQSKNIGNYSEKWEVIYSYSERGGSYPSYCKRTIRYWLVDKTPPGYCTDLWSHENTYFKEGPQLVTGEYPWETHWED